MAYPCPGKAWILRVYPAGSPMRGSVRPEVGSSLPAR